MSIVNLQRRGRELGRIRIGQVVRTSKGKTAPEKLDRFRLTSASRPLLEKVAALYGGQVQPWTPQGGGPEAYEVITESTRLPILVPPQPITQYFELWSGGGCQRRCDGVTELLSNAPCMCSLDPADRDCKPTTRLNVVLRDVEGIGLWRLETKGYYAATELPDVAEFLARAGGYVSAHLGLEERVIKREGRAKRFMVPTIEVDVTPAQLLSGAVQAVQVGSGVERPALPAAAPQAISGPQDWQPGEPVPAGYRVDVDIVETATEVEVLVPDRPPLDVDSVRAAINAATTVATLRELWPQIKEACLTAEATKRANDIEQAAAQESGDPDQLWTTILQKAPEEWTTEQIEADFQRVTGVDAGEATAAHMSQYLQHLGS